MCLLRRPVVPPHQANAQFLFHRNAKRGGALRGAAALGVVFIPGWIFKRLV